MAKSIIFSELLQGSHTTSERQTPTGIMLPLGLLVHQVLSNSEEVMCEHLKSHIWDFKCLCAQSAVEILTALLILVEL